MPDQPVLHMIAGKIASGKSTLAAELSAGKGTVRISEDAWLNVLFADQMTTPKDYVRCTARLRAAVGPQSVICCGQGCLSCSTLRQIRQRCGRGCARSSMTPEQPIGCMSCRPMTRCVWIGCAPAMHPARIRFL